jgi:hypothetical protein
MRKAILLLSAAGVAAGVLYVLESKRRKASEPKLRAAPEKSSEQFAAGVPDAEIDSVDDQPTRAAEVEPEIDDRGTGQSEAHQILLNIRDAAFDASDEKLAVALGRPLNEVAEWTRGDGVIDGDVVMKARTLAMQRNVEP